MHLLILTLFLPPTAADAAPAPSAEPINSYTVSPAFLLAQDADEDLNKWTGSVNLGLTITQGNSEATTFTAAVDAQHRTENNRTTVKAWRNYGEQTAPGTSVTQKTVDNTGGSLKHDIFASEKMYYFGIAGAQQDRIADLDLRYYAGAGVGYQIAEKEDYSLSTELGLTYFSEEFLPPPVGLTATPDDDYLAARAAYDMGWQATETTRVEQTAEIFPNLDDTNDYYATVDTRVKVSMTESMFAQFQWVIFYDRTPAAGAKKTDHRFIVGVGWGF